MRCYPFFFFLFLASSLAVSQEPPVYETVVTDRSATDILSEDAYLPSIESAISKGSGKGTISSDLEAATGLPVRTLGAKPGALSSFSGLGRGSDEVGFQSLGVPLNPPQGGGFDLSSFPQFLWSKSKFQQGGISGAYDPRGAAATVTLTPWSSDAMNLDAPGVELFMNNSSANLIQSAVGVHAQRERFRTALLLGNSEGSVQGPSTCFSLGVGSFKTHFIATDQTTSIAGTKSNPTPKAVQRNLRGMPVVEYGTALGSDWKFQTTGFFDVGFLRIEDPENSYNHTRDHFNQLGGIVAATDGKMRLGGGYRKVEYSGLTYMAPTQSIFHLSASRTYAVGLLSIEPQVRGVGDQSTGVLPEGNISMKRSFGDSPWAAFSRVSYTNELPSLQNRYYKTDSTFYQFVPNPDLKTEKIISPVLGLQYQGSRIHGSVEGLAQFRNETQITASSFPGGKQIDHPVNSGDGELYSGVERTQFDFTNDLSFLQNLTWAKSHLSQTNGPFPYQRSWMGSAVGRYRFFDLTFRGASDAFVSDTIRVPAYGLWDLGLHGSWFSGSIEASLQIENLLNQTVEFVHDYSSSGRIVSLGITGRF